MKEYYIANKIAYIENTKPLPVLAKPTPFLVVMAETLGTLALLVAIFSLFAKL